MPRMVSGLLFAMYPLLFLLLDPIRSAEWLIGLFVILLITQIALHPRWSQALRIGMCGGIAVLGLLAFLYGTLAPIMMYPVLVNLAAAGFCVYTLIRPPSAIARLSRGMGMRVEGIAIPYTTRLTGIWLGFFLANATAAAALAVWAPLDWWALYTGMISYVLIGLLLALEYPVRLRYQRRHGEQAL